MKKNIKLFTISSIFISINLILSGTEISAQTNFTYITNHPVFSYGASGEWDEGTVWNPAVIKDGDTLRMWYTGYDVSVWEEMMDPNGKIGYAWSLNGEEWNRFDGNPVLTAQLSWENKNIYECTVLKDDDTLKMWYGANGIPSRKIGYAWSLDGINWNRHPDPVLELGPKLDWDSYIISPTTVIKENSYYKMWYWAGLPGFPFEASIPKIGLATSTDGVNWIKHDDPTTTESPLSESDPVLQLGDSEEWDSNRAIQPMVLATDSGYAMWYLGLKPPISDTTIQRIGYATSTDGIEWDKWKYNPIISTNPNWGKSYYGGTVLKFNDRYHLWFSCFHTPPTKAKPQIGYTRTPLVGIKDFFKSKIPSKYNLLQNYPNPFNPKTTICYAIPITSQINLSIYNILGEKVAMLISKIQHAGSYKVEWDASGFTSGIYLYKLSTNNGFTAEYHLPIIVINLFSYA